MTKLSLEKVAEIADMARLGLSKEAQKVIQQDSNNLLLLLEKLNTIDIEGITQMYHTLDLPPYLHWRDDKVTEVNQREHFHSIAPIAKNGYYLVPKVVDASGIDTQKPKQDNSEETT